MEMGLRSSKGKRQFGGKFIVHRAVKTNNGKEGVELLVPGANVLELIS